MLRLWLMASRTKSSALRTLLVMLPALSQADGLAVTPFLATGSNYTLVVKADGTLRAMGDGSSGQLGVKGVAQSSVPAGVTGPGPLQAVSAGDGHTVALAQDGTVWTWGSNTYGQLGDGTAYDRSTPARVPGLSGIVSIAAGSQQTFAVKRDGTVLAWGWNGYGQLGDGTTLDRAKPVPVQGLTGITAIASGYQHTLALKQDSTVWAWGGNTYGQLGDGSRRAEETYAGSSRPVQIPGLSGIKTLAAGAHFSAALTQSGEVWTWGNNDKGQLGDGTNQIRRSPVAVSNASGVTALAAGYAHLLALRSNGNLWAWGNNASGQLGDGTKTARNLPLAVPGISQIRTIAAGYAFSLALKQDGTVLGWGGNHYGQLGDGTCADRYQTVLAINETVDGYLDLMPEVQKTIPPDKIPPFLTKVTPTPVTTNILVKYDPQTLGKNGNVYVTGFVKANSPLLANGRVQGFATTDDAVIPVVLTQGGFKQTGAGAATEPVYSGPLNAANNTFNLYDPAHFDSAKDYGVFCVGYATDVGTTSAKGQVRAAVTGQIDGAYQCPPIQINAVSSFTATSNNRTELLTINAAIAPKTEDIGKPMNIYTWAMLRDGSFFVKKGEVWDAMSALQLDTNFPATLTGNLTVPVVDSLDLRSLVGTNAYVGYGVSEKDMLDNGRYGSVYTIQ